MCDVSFERLSAVRILENSDTGTKANLRAHTAAPLAARMNVIPIVLRNVLLPAIFAPVTMAILSLFNVKLLGIPFLPDRNG